MHIVISLVVGAVVGWLASLFMGTNAQMGLIGNVLIGIVGSGLGHWLAGAMGLGAGSPIVRLLVSVLGACILIFVLRAVGFMA